MAVRVRSARRRKPSSAAWLSRQLNDPYVAEARRLGYRSRAAFKLIELNDRFRLLRPGARVVDLGCTPGGWTQVAVARVGARGAVVGVDIAETAPIAGAAILCADIDDPTIASGIKAELGNLADLVLSDMAPPATGHPATDHLRIVSLAESAFAVASEVLKPGGAFVAKVFQGGAQGELLARLKGAFAEVRQAKPPASRAQSAETYVIAKGFRGRQRDPSEPPGNRLAADADRGIGPRNQERAWKAARAGSTGPAGRSATVGACEWRRRLSTARQQHDCGG